MSLNGSDLAMQHLGEGPVGVGARILSLIIDYYGLLGHGQTPVAAIQRLRSRAARYGAVLVEQFAAYLEPQEEPARNHARKIPLRSVRPGMVILQEVRTEMGTLLVPSGFEVTPVFLERMRHFGPDLLSEAVAVDDSALQSDALPPAVLERT